MRNLYQDMLIGLFFITGVWCFISGQFVLSTVLFALAATYANTSRRTSWIFCLSSFVYSSQAVTPRAAA